MAETRTYQGYTYTRNSPEEDWVLVGPAAQQTPGPVRIGQPDPYREAEEARRQQDQEFEAARLRIAQQNANKPPAGYRWGASGDLEIIPGGPADPEVIAATRANAGLTSEARGKLEAQFAGAQGLVNRIKEIEERFNRDMSGKGIGGLAEYLPGSLRPANQEFNDAGRALMGSLAAAFGLSAQQQNTPQELEIRFGPFIPQASDRDEVIAAKIARLKEIARDQGGLALQQLGREDEIEPFIAELGAGDRDLAPPPPLAAAGAGATEQSVPLPPEMQAEHRAYMQQNAGRLDPDGYAAFRAQLDQKYGFEGDPQAYRDFALRANEAVQNGGRIGEEIPPVNEELSGVDRLRNDLVSNPLGAAGAGYFNAASLGIPGLIADDQMDALRSANPISSTLGEIAGGITGTVGAGAALGMGSRALGGEGLMASLLARPITADAAYGGVYGATQADNPLAGLAGGAASAVAGSYIGSQVARRVPGLVGLRRPPDELSRGERRVYDAVERTGIDPVVEALASAADMGIPASPADVSPELNSLTGAALRRSPAAAGMARETLGQRSRSQYDRFLGAVERDLGPISNIPQRSEDLITQARTAAGPLYEAAYAAPGATALELSDLLTRPSMNKALSRAARLAQEEGRDPNALGFVFNEAGEATAIEAPSWQTLDYIKRGLDDVVQSNRSTNAGRLDTEGRAVNQTLQDLLQRMDRMNPDYAAARAAYASPMQERAALEAGQEALRASPNQLAVDAANASPTQIEQMRLGFQSGLAENAARVRSSTNPFESVLGTPAMEQRLGSLYPDRNEEIARLLMQRDMERQLAGSTNRLIGNSATAERQIADEAFTQSSLMGDVAQGALETAVTGAPVATALRSAAGRGVGGWMRDARTLGVGRRATALADEIAPLALNTNPAAARDGLLDMQQRAAAYDAVLQALIEQAQGRGGHMGGGVAAALYGGSQY